ncbi:MAG: DNRLRE domain-containing protein [Chloroflexi bacterium]|nr:DNRLRE domain-containing protein [Chloroflexota bacterium]
MTKPAKFLVLFSFMAFFIMLPACSPSNVTPAPPTQISDVESSTPTVQPTSTPIPSSTPVVPTATVTMTATPTATPQPIQQTITIPVSGDTFIYAHPNASATNYGLEDRFTLGGDSDGNPYVVLLDFDIFDYIPSGSVIIDANLQITADEPVFWGFSFTIHPIITSWDEKIVTANSQPTYDATIALDYNLDETNQSMSFPIAEIVQKWVSGELDENGLRLSANVMQNTETFYAKEGYQTNSVLVITYETVPGQTIVEAVDTEPADVEGDSFHLEPDLLLVMTPWEKLQLGMENKDIDTRTAAGTAELASILGLDLQSPSGMGQLRLLMYMLIQLGFGNDRNVPIAVAESPDITIDSVLERIPPNGFLGFDAPEINLEDYGQYWGDACNAELTCADSRILSYLEGGLGIYVTDGLMLMIMSGPPTASVNILDLVDARYDGSTDILNTILFFQIMHDTFGIPYDLMEIYPYDGLGRVSANEDYWPTKYMAIYWAGDGEFVVPRVTAGDLSEQYDAILQYDIRVSPPNIPFTFRRWFDPLNPNANSLRDTDTELQLLLTPCSNSSCTKSLFDNDLFRDGYYEMGSYPYESIEIELDVEPAANMPYWLVGYLTNKPFLLESP